MSASAVERYLDEAGKRLIMAANESDMDRARLLVSMADSYLAAARIAGDCCL